MVILELALARCCGCWSGLFLCWWLAALHSVMHAVPTESLHDQQLELLFCGTYGDASNDERCACDTVWKVPAVAAACCTTHGPAHADSQPCSNPSPCCRPMGLVSDAWNALDTVVMLHAYYSPVAGCNRTSNNSSTTHQLLQQPAPRVWKPCTRQLLCATCTQQLTV